MKNLIILSNLPIGKKEGPSFARIIEYAKGLIYEREDLKVYIASLQHTNHSKSSSIGFGNQISILGEYKKVTRNFFLDKYFYSGYREIAFKSILDKAKKIGNCIFLLYPFFCTWIEEKKYISQLKQNSFKVFSERNERALGIFINKTRPRNIFKIIVSVFLESLELINSILQDRLVIKYEGNIVISTRFEKWISDLNPNKIRIPVLANITNTNVYYEKRNRDVFCIGYFGSLNFSKEGLKEVLKAIKKIIIDEKDSFRLRFNIYGYGSSSEVNRLKSEVRKLKLNDYVFYYGNVSSKVAKEEQLNQDLLVLVRKQSLQTNFGFSTKLAEYMTSGRPVLITDVSDNNHFIRNGFDAFYCQYSSANIASKIQEIYNLPEEERLKVAKSALEVAKKHFTVINYAKTLQQFLGV